MFENLLSIVVDVLHLSPDQVKDITYDTNLVVDLDVDSLDVVEISMSVEDVFEIEVDDEEVERWKTIGDIIETIENNI